SFVAALDSVEERILTAIGSRASSRPMKSTQSNVRKLREKPSMRLSQMRDIAGCRVVVEGGAEQNAALERLRVALPDARVSDHRVTAPASGYRAVHLEVRSLDRRVEIQVRTRLEDQWANL